MRSNELEGCHPLRTLVKIKSQVILGQHDDAVISISVSGAEKCRLKNGKLRQSRQRHHMATGMEKERYMSWPNHIKLTIIGMMVPTFDGHTTLHLHQDQLAKGYENVGCNSESSFFVTVHYCGDQGHRLAFE